MIVDFVGQTGGGQNVERKILALRPWNIRVTINPAEAGAAGKVGDETTVSLNEVVAATERQSKVVVLRSSEDWFGHGQDIELVIAAQPAFILSYTPAYSRAQKAGPDFIAVRISKNPEDVAGIRRYFKSRRIKNFRCGGECAIGPDAGARLRSGETKDGG